MNQDILRFGIPKVLVEKGKGKLMLRLYMSWHPLGLLISWYLSLFLSSVPHPLPERVYVCFINPDCLQYATDSTTFLHKEDCLHRGRLLRLLGTPCTDACYCLEFRTDTKRDPEHVGGNVISHLQLRPYLFGKGPIRTTRTSRHIAKVLSGKYSIFHTIVHPTLKPNYFGWDGSWQQVSSVSFLNEPIKMLVTSLQLVLEPKKIWGQNMEYNLWLSVDQLHMNTYICTHVYLCVYEYTHILHIFFFLERAILI